MSEDKIDTKEQRKKRKERRKNRKKLRKKNKSKWTTKKKVLVGSLITIMVIILSLGGAYLYVRGKIYEDAGITSQNNNNNGINDKEEIEVKYDIVDGITNVLLLGTDGRNLDENSRSDAIIIATLDNNNKNIKLTSLFRDTLVNIPGYGEGKINSAMELGGVQLLMDTIASTYDIRIDKYLTINFWGFEEIIDQIGGIEVEIEEYMLNELNKYIGESTGGNDCPVTEIGLQTLNGKQALSYARIRKGVGDDYKRTDRQREVVLEVAEKLKETKPSKYLGIMNNMLDHVKTNIEPFEALNLAYSIYKLPTLEIQQLQIPLTNLSTTMTYKNLGSVFVMDTYQNASILQRFIFENEVTSEDELDYYSLYAAIDRYEIEQASYEAIYGESKDEESDDILDEEDNNEVDDDDVEELPDGNLDEEVEGEQDDDLNGNEEEDNNDNTNGEPEEEGESDTDSGTEPNPDLDSGSEPEPEPEPDTDINPDENVDEDLNGDISGEVEDELE